ncbi:MAG: hemin uptake protein HemP [Qingshengfaniella sp.]
MNMISRSEHTVPRSEWQQVGPPLHDARLLTEGGALAQIRLDAATYTLRITRAGKLILTK